MARARGGGATAMNGAGAAAAKAKAKKQRWQRLRQLGTAYAMTAKADPRVGLVVGLTALAVFLAFLLLGFLVGHPIYFGLLGLLTALLAGMIVFSRRAQRAAYAQIEGQPGAAAGVLQSMRGWLVTPAVAVNRNQDIVHRAVGRAGVVLVGEGAPGRVSALIAQEKKRLVRVVPDVPVYDLQVGNGEGQVPLGKLQRQVVKLPRNLRGAQVSDVERRLKALGGLQVPLPKGPMPRNVRPPRSPRR